MVVKKTAKTRKDATAPEPGFGDVPVRTVERLALYRRILRNALEDKVENLYSHEIASTSGVTSDQVRRDLMQVGYLGHPRHGYQVAGLLSQLDEFFDAKAGIKMALTGVGNLGRAVLAYFSMKKPHLSIEAAFDEDPAKVNRVIHGCRCYPIDQLQEIVSAKGIQVGIVAVPASAAQVIADRLVAANVTGILNFAPSRLRVPPTVFVENFDMSLAIEKVWFFAKASAGQQEVK